MKFDIGRVIEMNNSVNKKFDVMMQSFRFTPMIIGYLCLSFALLSFVFSFEWFALLVIVIGLFSRLRYLYP